MNFLILHSEKENNVFQNYWQLYCDYLQRLNRIEEKQAAYERLSHFNIGSFTALKNLNNYNMRITNNSDKMTKS